MRISRCVERPENNISLIAVSVPIGVTEMNEIRDTEYDRAVFKRKNADGYVQPVGKRRDAIERAIAIGIFENLNSIARRFAIRTRIGILNRLS